MFHILILLKNSLKLSPLSLSLSLSYKHLDVYLSTNTHITSHHHMAASIHHIVFMSHGIKHISHGINLFIITFIQPCPTNHYVHYVHLINLCMFIVYMHVLTIVRQPQHPYTYACSCSYSSTFKL